MKKLYIISNENINLSNNNFFCDNKDLKSTPEGLSSKYEVCLIGRNSKKKRFHKINVKNIKIYKNILSYLLGIIVSFKHQNVKYLIISITPFTFFACILIWLFKKKPYVYLRSDGYSEYKIILGNIGVFLFHFMFLIVSKISFLISCRNYILRGNKGFVVHPSQLTPQWFKNQKLQNKINKVKLLYVGRLRKEKGIFSLIEIIKPLKRITLSIVGKERDDNFFTHQKNINIYNIEKNTRKLINHFDKHSIFILPSFTEGHPMVLLESLARLRPVIIFKEIKHVIGKKKGVFVAERNAKSLKKVIKYIKNNIKFINKQIQLNNLPQKKLFFNNIFKILNK